MYKVLFYKDKNGKEPVYDYIKDLASKKDKDSRIKLNKINDYIEALCRYGTYVGEPYVKHLEDEIWELRPLKERILFAAYIDNHFILLHEFTKKTRKTPRREIKKAKSELNDFLQRSKENV